MRLIFFFISICVTAQNGLQVKEVDSLMVDYNELFMIMKENTDSSFITNLSRETGNWKQFYTYPLHTVDSIPVSAQEEKEFPPINLGLNWYTETNHNFRPGLSETEHLTYKTRFSSGLDWNLIGEGSYLRNKKRQEILYKEYEIDRLQKDRAERYLQFSKKLSFIDEIFDFYRLNLYERFTTFYEKRQDLVRNLHHLELVNQVPLVRAENEYKNVLNKIRLFNLSKSSEYSDRYDSIPDLLRDDPDLPAWESIEVENLLELEKEEVALARDIILSSNKSDRGPRLRLKARYNYFSGIVNNDRVYGSIGATLNVPIEFKSNSEWRADFMADRKEIDFNYKRESLKRQLKSDYRHFYQLKNRKLELLNRMIYLEEYLKNEITVYKDFNVHFSPTDYIDKGVENIKIQEELIDIQQQLIKIYLKFLFDINYPTDWTFGISEIGMKRDFSKKTTYLWKEEFASVDNNRLITLLQQHEIGVLYLSPGELSDKLDNFLKLSEMHNINVARLIGENSYVTLENGKEKLLMKLQASKETGFSHIHLDIEPQQFLDYKLNRSFYDKQLSELFVAAIDWTQKNAVELSVSVPMNLDPEIAKLLIHHHVEVNVMAYEQKDQHKLFNRTKELRQILGDYLVWVIRLKDFSDSELKTALVAIREEGISKVGFYKLITLPNEI